MTRARYFAARDELYENPADIRTFNMRRFAETVLHVLENHELNAHCRTFLDAKPDMLIGSAQSPLPQALRGLKLIADFLNDPALPQYAGKEFDSACEGAMHLERNITQGREELWQAVLSGRNSSGVQNTYAEQMKAIDELRVCLQNIMEDTIVHKDFGEYLTTFLQNLPEAVQNAREATPATQLRPYAKLYRQAQQTNLN